MARGSRNRSAPQVGTQISTALSNCSAIDTLSIVPGKPGQLHFAIAHDKQIEVPASQRPRLSTQLDPEPNPASEKFLEQDEYTAEAQLVKPLTTQPDPAARN